jgi:hypothetical protein
LGGSSLVAAPSDRTARVSHARPFSDRLAPGEGDIGRSHEAVREMRIASSQSPLRLEVELALVAGRSLEQIESEVLARRALDEDSIAAMWLYAWSRSNHPSSCGPRHLS